jgi:hypothetical protein
MTGRSIRRSLWGALALFLPGYAHAVRLTPTSFRRAPETLTKNDPVLRPQSTLFFYAGYGAVEPQSRAATRAQYSSILERRTGTIRPD